MREIKFRAWDNTAKLMLEVDGIRYSEGRVFAVYTDVNQHNSQEPYDTWLDDGRFDVMQYTGLKDKNGKEIYESDYISDGLYKGLVEWGASGWVIGEQDLWAYVDEDRYEVVGNIYENSDLLTPKEIEVTE